MFCPTRWIIHNERCASVFKNDEDLMELWEWLLSNIKVTEMEAQIIGAKAIMKSFKFMFACKLGEVLLRETDMLSISLQEKSVSAFQGKSTEFIG